MNDEPQPVTPYEALTNLHRTCLTARDAARIAVYTDDVPPSVTLMTAESYAAILKALHHAEIALNRFALELRQGGGS